MPPTWGKIDAAFVNQPLQIFELPRPTVGLDEVGNEIFVFEKKAEIGVFVR